MKSMTKKILLSALALLGVVSCVKDPFDESLGERISITLTAENPGFGDTKTTASSANSSAIAPIVLDSTATMEESIAALGDRVVYSDSTMFICAPQGMAFDTKTGMDKDGRPFWEKDDKLGLFVVSNVSGKINYDCISLDNVLETASYNTSFTGTYSKQIKNSWPFYPYNDFQKLNSTKTVSLTISDKQTPSRSNSFDGKSDILVGAKLKLSTPKNIEINEDVAFKRKIGFLKFGLFDLQGNLIENDYIRTLTFTVPNYQLVGSCTLCLETGNLTMSAGVDNCTVTYPDNVQSLAAFMNVFPGKIPSDSEVSIVGKTKNKQVFSIKKKLNQDITIGVNQYTYIGLKVTLQPDTEDGRNETNAWDNFTKSDKALKNAKSDNERNAILAKRILLDYSYAGYDHGETVPASIPTNWEIINVAEHYQESDGKCIITDSQGKGKEVPYYRKAFMRALNKAKVYDYDGSSYIGTPIPLKEANCIIKFPAGIYVLHDSTDDTKDANFPEGFQSHEIQINAGHLIIAGAGMNETILVMKTPNYPNSDKMYSSPEMILFKNKDCEIVAKTAQITSDVTRGAMSVKVAKDPGVNAGDWVVLSMDSNSKKVLEFELQGKTIDSFPLDFMSHIKNNVTVRDYHQVKEYDAETKTLFFCEPIMREVNITERDEPWFVSKYNHYEQVGVENLTFKGNALENFRHHGGHKDTPGYKASDGWKYDGAFKPITYTGYVNSWIRNVKFTSVSECMRLKMCANCSAYDIQIDGNRGHAGVSAAGSSRIFIGNIVDQSEGYPIVRQEPQTNKPVEKAGQYHASGVSKPSMGTVLWKNTWGYDATFESHSGQPRATLVDNCRGGWVESRFGGATEELPNHLGDLTIWNFDMTNYRSTSFNLGSFQWWRSIPNTAQNKLLWRVVPPIVVGFPGVFDTSSGQMSHYEENKGAVTSLYTAQLELRHAREGISNEWLNYLQSNQ